MHIPSLTTYQTLTDVHERTLTRTTVAYLTPPQPPLPTNKQTYNLYTLTRTLTHTPMTPTPSPSFPPHHTHTHTHRYIYIIHTHSPTPSHHLRNISTPHIYDILSLISFTHTHAPITLTGDNTTKDTRSKQDGTLNPDFFSYYEFSTTLPGPSLLKVCIH